MPPVDTGSTSQPSLGPSGFKGTGPSNRRTDDRSRLAVPADLLIPIRLGGLIGRQRQSYPFRLLKPTCCDPYRFNLNAKRSTQQCGSDLMICFRKSPARVTCEDNRDVNDISR